MKAVKTIVDPKEEKISETYCQNSFSDRSGERKMGKISLRKLRNIFKGEKRSWLQIYMEDIYNRKKMRFCGVKQ